MKKMEYYISTNKKNTIKTESVIGYVLDAEIGGTAMQLGIHKNERGNWMVDDVASGLCVNPGHTFRTRKEALAYIEGADVQTGKSLAELICNIVTGEAYKEKCATFGKLVEKARKASAKQEHATEQTHEHIATEKVEELAMAVTLETMSEWCKGHNGTEAVQYGEGNAIWVYGVNRKETELQAELRKLGFCWAPKARHGAGWWAKPTA